MYFKVVLKVKKNTFQHGVSAPAVFYFIAIKKIASFLLPHLKRLRH